MHQSLFSPHHVKHIRGNSSTSAEDMYSNIKDIIKSRSSVALENVVSPLWSCLITIVCSYTNHVTQHGQFVKVFQYIKTIAYSLLVHVDLTFWFIILFNSITLIHVHCGKQTLCTKYHEHRRYNYKERERQVWFSQFSLLMLRLEFIHN